MKNKSGSLTVIEIVIIFVIIGLLAAIAIPSFIQARNNAQHPNELNEKKIGEINNYDIYQFSQYGTKYCVAVPKSYLEK